MAPALRWLHDYGRTIRPAARSLAILQPIGPVTFVFDVSHTEGSLCPLRYKTHVYDREESRKRRV